MICQHNVSWSEVALEVVDLTDDRLLHRSEMNGNVWCWTRKNSLRRNPRRNPKFRGKIQSSRTRPTRGDQIAFFIEQGTGEVQTFLDVGGTGRSLQNPAHLFSYRHEAMREDRQLNGVEFGGDVRSTNFNNLNQKVSALRHFKGAAGFDQNGGVVVDQNARTVHQIAWLQLLGLVDGGLLVADLLEVHVGQRVRFGDVVRVGQHLRAVIDLIIDVTLAYSSHADIIDENFDLLILIGEAELALIPVDERLLEVARRTVGRLAAGGVRGSHQGEIRAFVAKIDIELVFNLLFGEALVDQFLSSLAL